MSLRTVLIALYREMIENRYGVPTPLPVNKTATVLRVDWERYGAVLADLLLVSNAATVNAPNTLTGQTLWGAAAEGEMGYLSGADTWSKAIATGVSSAKARGVYVGNSGELQFSGVVSLRFVAGIAANLAVNKTAIVSTTAGEATVYGAAGAPIAGQFICEVGTIVDTSTYAGVQRCKVLFDPSFVIQYQ